jgi:hypothetical protein
MQQRVEANILTIQLSADWHTYRLFSKEQAADKSNTNGHSATPEACQRWVHTRRVCHRRD